MTCCGKEDCKLEIKTPFNEQKLLTIGMATYDDFDGVFFTTQAILQYHREILPYVEILVVDNNPNGICAKDLREYIASINSTYIAFSDYTSTAVRNLVFEHAKTPYVLCTDSHVLFQSGSLAKLLMYYQCNENSMDLIQGPLLTDDWNNSTIWTHFDPVWRDAMYGIWATDERGLDQNSPAFDIPMQGLGVFSCRKDAWLGFNKNFRGFGGEEGYIHEKFRKHGRRTLCLPSLRWIHRFRRPLGPQYSLKIEDRIRNYFIGSLELGQKVQEITKHFMYQKRIPESTIAKLYKEAAACYNKS